MKARKLRSTINKIKDSSGVWLEDDADIQKLFVNDFELCFTSAQGPSNINVDLPDMVSPEEHENLIKPIEDYERKEVVFQKGKFKAQGSDGFSAALF